MAAIETKVTASTSAAAVSGMVLWVLGKYVFKGGVPDVFASWIYIVVPGLLAWAAGYFAPHTHRPDLAPPAGIPPARPALEEAPPGQPPAAGT
jgi:hypothetical protein